MEKKMLNFEINWSINNIADNALPYDMDIEMHNALHSYILRDLQGEKDYNKARAFEYLRKILNAQFRYNREEEAFMDIFAEDDNIIAYADMVKCYDDDFIIVAFHPEHSFRINVYAFATWNEGDIFEGFEYEEEEE